MRVRFGVGRGSRLTNVGISGSVVAVLAVAALGLSACSGGGDAASSNTGSAKPSNAASAQDVKIDISPADGKTDVNPTDQIAVKAANGTLTSVKMTNTAKNTEVKGELSSDKKAWQATEPLGYGASYEIVADGANSAGKQNEEKSTINTLTPKGQLYPAFIPAPEVNPSFGVGQIFGVSFDQPVTDKAAVEKALKVTSTPKQDGGWYWIDAKTVHYRPKTYWQAGTTVQLDAKLYGVDLGGGVYGQTDRSATYKIHDSWIAKADGNTKQMQIFHNGAMVQSMPISLGSTQNPTHNGPHVISDKQQQVVMDSATYGVMPGQPGYYKATEYWDERISNDGEFVHENANTVAQQGNTNVSHGCINLSEENAKAFFNDFNLGDVVEVTNSGGGTLPIYDTYGDWELSWADWQAGSALRS